MTGAPRAAGSIGGMTQPRILLVAAVVVPFALLAIASLFHPVNLTDDTAGLWFGLHLALIPVFPLVGFVPWLVARRVDRRLGWVAGALGFLYAAFYTSLDLLAGVGAGAVQLAGVPDAKAGLYAIGRVVAMVGVVSLVAAAVVASVAAFVVARLTALPGALLAVAGAVLLYRGHVYFGYGTLSMLLMAAGFTVLALVTDRGRTATEAAVAASDAAPRAPRPAGA